MSKPAKVALWKKLALSVSLPLALFIGGELSLRLFGYGQPLTFFIPDSQPGHLRTNPAFTSLVFPASFGLKPENFRIAKKKPSDTFRVFLLGESAAMGVPEPGFGLAPQLRAQWQAAYPTLKVEVYNLGVTAINSHCVRLIASEALQLEPDLLVIYMGNNEVVGPYGPSSSPGTVGASLPLIRTSLWIRSTRTGQLIQALITKLIVRGKTPEWRGMEMFTGKTVTANDPRLPRIYENFARNLDDMLSAAAARNVPVGLCTVAVNVRDCSPFASVHRPGLTPAELRTWEEKVQAARDAIHLEQFAAARELLATALTIDPEYAETHYTLASVLERLQQPQLARAEYFAALQLDALRFRADARVNSLIRRAGGSFSNVTLVDTALALGASTEARGELAGRNYFFEHVHLTWEGNHALGSALRSALTLGGERPAGAALSAEEVARRIGFTAAGRTEQLRRINELTQRPPFTGQATYARDRADADAQISSALQRLENRSAVEASLAIVAEASSWDPDNAFLPFHLAQLQAQLGRFADALEANRRAAELVPESPELLAQRGYLLIRSQEFSAAEAILRRSQKQFPYYFQTYGLLAEVWSASGRIREGATWFAEIVKQMPESRAALEISGQLLQALGDEDEAEAAWRKALAIAPDSEGSLMPLAQRLLASKRADEAVELLERAHRYNPKNLAVSALLERIYDQRGNLELRMKYMRAMIESGPVQPELFIDLGLLLRERGEFHDAAVLFFRGMRAAQSSGNEPAAQAAAEYLSTVKTAH